MIQAIIIVLMLIVMEIQAIVEIKQMIMQIITLEIIIIKKMKITDLKF